MEGYNKCRDEMKPIQQQMVQAKRNERVKVLIEVRCLREEFSFNAGMLTCSLAKGRKKQ